MPNVRRLPRIDNPNTISTLNSNLTNLIDPIIHPQQWNLTESLFQRHIPIHAQNHAKMAKCGRNLLWTFQFRVGQLLISPFVDRRKENFPFAITTLYTTSIIMLAECSSILVMLAFGRLIPRPIGNIDRFQNPLNLGPHTTSMVVWLPAWNSWMPSSASLTQYGIEIMVVAFATEKHGRPSKPSYCGASRNGRMKRKAAAVMQRRHFFRWCRLLRLWLSLSLSLSFFF